MDVKEQLERHVEETYGEEVYCMYPEGHAGDVIATRMTDSFKNFLHCTVCGMNTDMFGADIPDEIWERNPKTGVATLKNAQNCKECKDKTPHELLEYPIVQCILSEQRVLRTIRERLAPDYDNEQELDDEVLSEYCTNTTGGYYGPETPSFIDEFVKE